MPGYRFHRRVQSVYYCGTYVACSLLNGCGTSTNDRALSGAGIGAGTGALVGALFGGVGAIPGALVGAGAGAATGAVVDEERVNLGEAVWE